MLVPFRKKHSTIPISDLKPHPFLFNFQSFEQFSGMEKGEDIFVFQEKKLYL